MMGAAPVKFEDTEMAKTGRPFLYWRAIHRTYKGLSTYEAQLLRMRLLDNMSPEAMAGMLGREAMDIRIAYEIVLSKFNLARKNL